MSLKGTQLTPGDPRIPRGIRLHGTPEALQAYIAAHHARWKIVATMADGTPLVAEELEGRLLQTLSPSARRVVGAMLLLSPEVRREVLGAFTEAGAVHYPWPVAG
jgi:hypothetical protein